MTIIERIKELGLPTDEYAVFGSAWLEYWDLRAAEDIDILASPLLYDYLKTQPGWQEIVKDERPTLVFGDFEVTGEIRDLELIRDSVMVEGVPFVQIEDVILWKQQKNRPKDQSDVRMIMSYLGVR